MVAEGLKISTNELFRKGDIDSTTHANLLEIIEKQSPKKPINTKIDYVCPSCRKRSVCGFEKYCSHCGQKLDWSE